MEVLELICDIVDVVLRQINDETQLDDVGYDMDRLEQMIESGRGVPAAVHEAYIAMFRELYDAKGSMCEVVSQLEALKQAAEQEMHKL